MDQKDKLILDLSDDEVLTEHFSRKEPGERCFFLVEASLDEVANKMAVLSVEDVTVKAYKEKKKPEAKAEDSDEPAMAWAKEKAETPAAPEGY
jgi:hypothetical protein